MSTTFIELTPGQQMALLELRNCDLGNTVLRFMRAHSTARPTGADLHSIERLGLAIYRSGNHFISPRGMWRANEIARALANEYGIQLPNFISHRQREAGRYGRKTKGTFHPW